MCQPGHQATVGFEKIVVRQLTGLGPDDLLKDLIGQGSGIGRNPMKNEAYLKTIGVSVLKCTDLGTDLGFYAELLTEFPAKASRGILSRLDLAPGKLPLEWKSTVALALADKETSVLQKDTGGDSDHL
jgi:hypothetical protein